MHSKQLLALLLLLSAIVYQVAGDCVLKPHYIQTSNRIFLLRDERRNFELLLRDSVPNGKTLYLACNTTEIIPVLCSVQGRMTHNLPTSPCKKPLAVWREINGVVPGPSYKIYSVGYNIKGAFVELYRSIYSKSGVSAMYSVYKSYTGNIVTMRPNQTFTGDNIVPGRDSKSFKKNDIFYRFKTLFGDNQMYIPNNVESIIERGHLAPVADFLFDHDMRATFKYINVVAQFGSINRGNWYKIEKWVRGHSSSEHIPYRVLTGGYDVLKLQQPGNKSIMTDVFLLSGDRNPVPKWTFKLVEKGGLCTAFTTYNNIYDNNVPTSICRLRTCPSINLNNTDMTQGYTYCCDKTDLQRILNITFC